MHFILPRLWLLALLMFCRIILAAGMPDTGIAVIMAPGAAQPKLDRDDLALIFKRKKRFGDEGQHIQPVNLSAIHPLRRAFSMQIFGRNPEELEDYWRDMYFHGVQPPYVLASEEAVIRFVAATPGAIGYVSLCVVDQRISVVMRLDNGSACPR
jgi:ABC-type phosphate transport system substrate-binding protein